MTDDIFTWVRWILGGIGAVVAALLALAWKGLNGRIETIEAVTQSHTAIEVLHGERITRVEERFSAHTGLLERIDRRLERIEAKLDQR